MLEFLNPNIGKKVRCDNCYGYAVYHTGCDCGNGRDGNRFEYAVKVYLQKLD